MHDFEVSILAPKACRGKIKINKKTITNNTVIWSLQPLVPFPAGELIHLQFSYSSGYGIRRIFYVGEEGSFASPGAFWYPMAWGYGNCTGKMVFAVPNKYIVIATGKRISLPEQEESGQFAFNITQPSLLTFAAARYVVERRTDVRGNTISAYLLKPRAHSGFMINGSSAKVLLNGK